MNIENTLRNSINEMKEDATLPYLPNAGSM